MVTVNMYVPDSGTVATPVDWSYIWPSLYKVSLANEKHIYDKSFVEQLTAHKCSESPNLL